MENNLMARPVVAAICYRRVGGNIEFLLVRTKGGKYWTFPKGHVEKDPPELPWQAAQREASEEAGVSGAIETEPVTSYAYSKGKQGREDIVAAYLMLVESERKPDEPEREPRWFTPDDATKRLGKGREKEYAREHQRVINEALARLK
jgi:8-oxo-dGTP pyrophosphatase MutT (NUDIX family)